MTHPLVRITDAHFHREVRTLPNGLRVAIEAGRDSSMVAIHSWLLAGKAREREGARGIAHVVEHLLVEGAQKSFPGGLTQHLERLGGEFNMWVALKCVVVFLIVPRDQLDEGLRIASTVLFRPQFTEELVQAELEVIRRELVGKGEASLPPIEATKAALLSVFGHRLAAETDLPQFGLADVQEFHRTLYAPNNAVIAVAGGVDPDEVERAALRHFGDLPRRDVPTLYSTRMEDRSLVVVPGTMTGGCGLAIGWAVPELPSDIEAGLTVVHLGSTDPGDTSGRRSIMLAEELAWQAAPYLYFEKSPAIVSFTYFCPEENVEPIVRTVTAEVDALRRDPLPASIVERVRWSIALETARENENPQNRARRVGCFELLKSGLQTISQGSRAIAEVDGPTARDVAAKVLTPARRLVLVVAPPDRVEAMQARLAPLAAELAAAARGGPAVLQSAPAGQSTHALSSGGVLVADRNPESDLAVVIVGFREAGTAYERPSAAGAATVLAGGLGLAEGVPPPGGRITPWVDSLGLGLKIECVADLLPEWLDRVGSHFGSPSDEIVEYGIASATATLDSNLQDPETQTLELGLSGLLGRHPFARTSAAARRALGALTPDAVRRHAAERMTADRLYVAAAGGIDPAALARAFDKLVPRFGLEERARAVGLPAVPRPALPTVLAADVPRPDVHHVVDWRAVPMDHADRAALMLVDCALSWYGGRLFRRLREERQLIYHLITTERFFPSLGLYGLTCATSAEGAAETLRELGAIIRSVARDGLDAEELERCRSAVIGSAIIEATPADARAEALSADITAGVTPGSTERVRESLARVDLATVNRVARQILKSDRMALAVVGPDARRRRSELLQALLGRGSGARPRAAATARPRPGART